MEKLIQLMIRIIQKIDSFFNHISKICAIISGVLLICVTIMICAGVINRAFLGFTWLFVEEYSALALIPISFMTMGYTLRWNQHLRMDLVTRRVSTRIRQIFGIFAAVFSLFCISYMILSSLDWFWYTFDRHVTSSGTLRTPLWFVSGTIVAGIGLFAIDMLLLIIHRVIEMVKGEGTLHFMDDEKDDEQTDVIPQKGV